MPKQTIHIGIAVVCEPKINSTNLISLAACVEGDVFSVNIGENEEMDPGRYWAKHLDEWAKIRSNQIPSKVAFKQYTDWVSRYAGRHIAVCSALDFYQFFYALIRETGKCSFGTNGHIDWATQLAAKTGDYTLQGARFKEPVSPIERASERAKYRRGLAKMERPEYGAVAAAMPGPLRMEDFRQVHQPMQGPVEHEFFGNLQRWQLNNNIVPIPVGVPNVPVWAAEDRDEVPF